MVIKNSNFSDLLNGTVFLFCLLSFCFIKQAGTEENPFKLEIIANIKVENVRSVALRDNFAYIAGYYEFVIADVKDVKNPVILSKLDISGIGFDIELKGNYAFIASRNGGINIYNIKNPLKPQYVTTYDTIEQATGLGINGNILLCANRIFGLELIDVTNPEKPEFIGKIKTAEAQGVASRDNYAYVGEHYPKSLTIVDISNPSKPNKVRSVQLQGNAWGVVLKGNYAYVATGHDGHGVCVVDITNPKKAKLVDTFTISNEKKIGVDCWEVAISGNNLFLADGYNGLFIFDISQPDKLKLITSLDTPGYAHNLALTRDVVFVADYDGGLQIISAKGLSDKQLVETGMQPEIIKEKKGVVVKDKNLIKYISKGQIRSCFIDDKYIYVAEGKEGMGILLLDNPEKYIGGINDVGIIYDVVVANNIAFLACGMQGIKIIDIQDKTNPKTIKNIFTDKFISELYLVGEKIVVRTSGFADIAYIDIKDVKNPVIHKQDIKLNHFLFQVSEGLFNNKYFGVVNGFSFEVIGFDEKNEMKIISKGEKKGYYFTGIALKNNFLYVTARGKLLTYDSSNPEELKEISEIDTINGSRLLNICISDNNCCVTTDDSIVAVDLTNPSSPKIIKEIKIPGIKDISIYRKIIKKGNNFYVCTGYSGLWILNQNNE